MRVLAIILLFVATGCHAQDTNGITRRVFERDSDKDGKSDLRVETVYRDGTKVMLVWSKPDALTIDTSRVLFCTVGVLEAGAIRRTHPCLVVTAGLLEWRTRLSLTTCVVANRFAKFACAAGLASSFDETVRRAGPNDVFSAEPLVGSARVLRALALSTRLAAGAFP
jgi:hypothetical protein